MDGRRGSEDEAKKHLRKFPMDSCGLYAFVYHVRAQRVRESTRHELSIFIIILNVALIGL